MCIHVHNFIFLLTGNISVKIKWNSKILLFFECNFALGIFFYKDNNALKVKQLLYEKFY